METVVLIAAGALLAIALLMLVSHFLGWSTERVTGPLRASTVEAGERTSDWAAEFWRWLRSGR